MSNFITNESVTIDAPGGSLHGELSYPQNASRAAVLIANPHPLMGGNINNNVIACLAEGLADWNYTTLCFNYGVAAGKEATSAASLAQTMNDFWETGAAPDDPLMIQDLQAARQWLADAVPLPLVMIGYSFGAFAVTQVARGDEAACVLIAPTLAQHNFPQTWEPHVPLMVAYSDNDFATPVHLTEKWTNVLGPIASPRCFSGADHFYKHQAGDLLKTIVGFLDPYVASGVAQ